MEIDSTERETAARNESTDIAYSDAAAAEPAAPAKFDDDPLADFRAAGGVRHAEYEQAEVIVVSGLGEVNSIAFAAAGTTDGVRKITEGERFRAAQDIDTAVRQHAAWLDSRPLMEQFHGFTAPVIFVGPAE